MIRAVLVWIFIGIGPPPTYDYAQRVDIYGGIFIESVVQGLPWIWKFERVIGWILWMGLLIFFANVWKNYVDVPCVELTRWVEGVMNGERVVSLGFLQKRLRQYRLLRDEEGRGHGAPV